MIATTPLFLSIGCWAPEVKPPEPKLSPRELAAKEYRETVQVTVPQPQKEPDTDPSPSKTEDLSGIALEHSEQTQRQEKRYPYSTTTSRETTLFGHGGGQIMTIQAGSTVDVLKKQDDRILIMCKNCSPNRPRQAGFILAEALLPNRE